MINSEIKDNLPQITSVLPKGIEAKNIYFNTSNERIYTNMSYGIIRLPISCKIDVVGKGSKIVYSLSDFKYGIKNLPIPKYIANKILDGSLRQEYNLQFKYNGIGIQDIRFENGETVVRIGLRL